MMNKNENLTALIDKAIAGDQDSLETVILSVRNLIFNLFLRILGTFHDAEDILGIPPETYRQRLNPTKLDYTAASKTSVDMKKAMGFKNAMEEPEHGRTFYNYSGILIL